MHRCGDKSLLFCLEPGIRFIKIPRTASLKSIVSLKRAWFRLKGGERKANVSEIFTLGKEKRLFVTRCEKRFKKTIARLRVLGE
jgi:hypothetical protein